MKRILVGLFLFACLNPGSAWAEQVYVRNHPFKGAVTGSGDSLMVGLEAFAQELGITVRQVDGAWQVGEQPIETTPGPDGQAMVSLRALGKAVNARVIRNASLGTVDVYPAVTSAGRPTTTAGAAPAAPAAPAPASGEVRKLNRSGESVDVARAAVPGKVTIVAFDAPW